MRVALISFCPSQDDKASKIIKTLQSVSTGEGNQVDLINGFEDLVNTRLTMYDYVAAVVKPKGFIGAKVNPRVSQFLATSGNVSGKKGCALVIKSGLSSEKTCRNLMRAMESEGVKLDYFEVVRDDEHARYAGKKIG
jgi:hypothetical protein